MILLSLAAVGFTAGCGSKAAIPPTVVVPRVPCPAGGPMPRLAAQASWTKPPPMKIKKSHSYTACIETKAGNIVINLMPKAATQAVNAFVILANHHFYDGSRFNLIAKGAYIGASASKQAKFSVPLKNAGTYFMPTTVFLNRTRSGRAELGSMFICSGAHCESLDATGSKRGSGYSVIGFVSKGQRVVTDIAQGSTTAGTSAGPLTQARAAKPTVVTTVRIYASYSPPSFPGDNSGS